MILICSSRFLPFGDWIWGRGQRFRWEKTNIERILINLISWFMKSLLPSPWVWMD